MMMQEFFFFFLDKAFTDIQTDKYRRAKNTIDNDSFQRNSRGGYAGHCC